MSDELGTPRQWMIAWAIMWEELERARRRARRRLDSEQLAPGVVYLMLNRFPTAFVGDERSLIKWCESHIIVAPAPS